MKVLSSFKNNRLTIFLSGELDHHEAKTAMKKIQSLIDDQLPRDCVIDMSGLGFMDSSGIALILRVYKLLNEIGGRAWIENPSAQVSKVIDASGIDRIVTVLTNKEEAKR